MTTLHFRRAINNFTMNGTRIKNHELIMIAGNEAFLFYTDITNLGELIQLKSFDRNIIETNTVVYETI